MDSFDLYREAITEYDRLILGKKKGLILLSLYSKFEEKEFTEEDIIDSIKHVQNTLGKNLERTEFEKNNKLILELQDKFLWRNSHNKKYRFKSHGIQYCELIKKRLQDDYSPTKIKRMFDELLTQLKSLIEQNIETGFSLWFEDHFIYRKPDLISQIESLDEQVNRSVEAFKSDIKKDLIYTDIISVFDAMDESLDQLKMEVSEMIEAFHSTYEIDELLSNLLNKSLEDEFEIENSKQVYSIFVFNKQVRASLEQISTRIDKLKPKIRDFFTGFNRTDSDRKSVKFLEYLLHNSKLSVVNGKKCLLPPKHIAVPTTSISSLNPDFVIVPQKEIGIKRPTRIQKNIVDEEKSRTFLNKTKASLYKKQRVKYWVNNAFEILAKSRHLDFSNFFFEILTSENQNLSIAVNTAQQVLKLSQKRQDLIINIEPKRIQNQQVEHIEIWKFNLQMK